MKNYRITVNGTSYDVSVEELSGGAAPVAAPVAAAPVAAPAAAPAAPAPAAGGAGSVKVSSPMPGKILAVKANVGDSVKKGQVILILEAMKMENEIGGNTYKSCSCCSGRWYYRKHRCYSRR